MKRSVSIEFVYKKEADLCIPYECREGIISREDMRSLAANLLRLAELWDNETIDQMNKEGKEREIALYNKLFEVRALEKKQRKLEPGVVYLILATGTGNFKIGRTKNLKTRLKSLRIKSPYELVVVHTISTPDTESLEAKFHSRFAEKKVHSEWFSLSEEDVVELCSYKEGDL